MKQTIYLYGGAFNPPTIGHQAILRALVAEARRNNSGLWLLPSGERADKTIGLTRTQRVELCEALIESINGARYVTIKTDELDRRIPTETIDTVRAVESAYPDRQFIWVFGSDSVATMTSWRQGQWLYDNLDMIVLQRPEYELLEFPPRASLLPVDMPAISSTQVRKLLRENKPITSLVPLTVAELLR